MADGLIVLDYSRQRARSSPAAGGTATATFDQVAVSELWLVERLVVTVTPGNDTAARVYVGDPTSGAETQEDGTLAGDYNVLECLPAGLLVPGGTSLAVVWSGASDSSVGRARAQIRRCKVDPATATPILAT